MCKKAIVAFVLVLICVIFCAMGIDVICTYLFLN